VAKPSADPTTRFFGELAGREHEPLLRKTSGSARFEIVDGRKTRFWHVAVERGDIVVASGRRDADCAIRVDKALFERMVNGRQNPVAAVLRGEAEVTGDWRLLVLIQRFFPGKRAPRRKDAS
jgi:hypothetical protein